jgi:hypothetical protein
MEEYLKYFEILELTPDATLKEIEKRHSHLKNLFSGDAIELTALNYDFHEEIREDYLARLDEANEKLRARFEEHRPVVRPQEITIDAELQTWIESVDCFTGTMLRTVRERTGVELRDIHAVTKIQPEHLKDIEDEQFDSFHAEVYLRSYLIEYSHFFRLNIHKVLNDYLPRYRAWAENRKVRGVSVTGDWLTKMT